MIAPGLERPAASCAGRYPMAGWYLRNVCEAFRITDAGGAFTMGRYGFEYGGSGHDRPWRREFLAALDRRINAKGGLPVAVERWRKLDPDYERHARLEARAIQTPRLRVYRHNAPREWQREPRLAHRWAEVDA